MLEPQIVAPAVSRIRPALRRKSHQRDVLRTEPHHDLLGINIRPAERRQRRLVGAPSRDGTKPQPVPVERLRTVQVRYHAADPQDALCLELAAPFHTAVNSRAVAGRIRSARQAFMLLTAP